MFLDSLRGELKTIKDSLKKKANIVMSPEDIHAFRIANECHVCGEALDQDKVCDHCHISGKYHGAAHNACNLMLCICPDKVKVPVVFHNL